MGRKRGRAVIRLRVQEVAKAKGMTQAGLSRKSDVDIKTLREIFHDPTRNITLDVLNRLANGLEVDARELIDYTPDSKR